jgi:putative transcriptional regulator
MDRVIVGGWLVVMALLVGGTAATPAPPGPPPSPIGLAGQLLVATEEIGDPRFHHAVIYMVHHDATGAMGLVVNKPLGDVPFASLLERLGRGGEGATGTLRVHYGGPVASAAGFLLHSGDWAGRESRAVQGNVMLTTDPAIFEVIARGAGPRRWLFMLGYAGWAAGQLEAEIDRGAWITVAADEGLIFDDAAAVKWERAVSRRKINL